MRIKAGVRVVPGIAWKPKGQTVIMRRRMVIEGQRETWRQADHRKRPGPSAPLSACGLCLSLLPANTVFQLLRGRSVGDSNESDSSVPFLVPSFQVLVLVSVPLPCFSVPLPLSLLCLSVSVTPTGRAGCSLSLPPPPPKSLLCLIT